MRIGKVARLVGSSRWHVAETALAQMLPSSVARLVVHEPRSWVALAQWTRGHRPAGVAFTYHRNVRAMFLVVIALVVIEGVVVEVVLAAALGSCPWVWLALGLHGYGVLFLLAAYASIVTRPHTVDDATVRLRTGLGTDVLIRRSYIADVTAGRFPGRSQARWTRNDDGTASLTFGDANVEIALEAGAEVILDGRALLPPPSAVYATVDDPRLFARHVSAAASSDANSRSTSQAEFDVEVAAGHQIAAGGRPMR